MERQTFRRVGRPNWTSGAGEKNISTRYIPVCRSPAWADPRDYSVRFFVGDELGQIRLNYGNGSTQIFPLILGESVWGAVVLSVPGTLSDRRTATEGISRSNASLSLGSRRSGNYIAVITPKPLPIRSITIENSPKKKSTVMISGITVESAESNQITRAIPLAGGTHSPSSNNSSVKNHCVCSANTKTRHSVD